MVGRLPANFAKMARFDGLPGGGKRGTIWVMGQDKRTSPRRAMYKVFRYAIEGREYADLSTNISDRGVFIKSFSPPPVGTEVTIFVKGPQEQFIRLLGRVAHVNHDPDPHKRGMGIEFTAVLAESPEIIRKFVDEIFPGQVPSQAQILRQPAQEKELSFEYRIVKKKDG